MCLSLCFTIANMISCSDCRWERGIEVHQRHLNVDALKYKSSSHVLPLYQTKSSKRKALPSLLRSSNALLPQVSYQQVLFQITYLKPSISRQTLPRRLSSPKNPHNSHLFSGLDTVANWQLPFDTAGLS